MKDTINLITDGRYKKFKIIFVATLLLFAIFELAFVIYTVTNDVENIGTFGIIYLNSYIYICLFCEIIYYLVRILPLKNL